MTVLQYTHFTAELWGALFCIVAAGVAFMTRYFDKKGANKLINLMVCTALLMICDALAWWFRGNPSEVAYYIVRITNFGAFFFGFLIMPLTAEYVSHFIEKRSGISSMYWKYIEWGLFLIGMVLLVINSNNSFMYTFDAQNTYYRLAWGVLPGLIALTGISVTLGIVFEYISYMNKFERVAIILFLVLPIIGTILQTFVYGMSLTYLALLISVLVLFFSFIYGYMQFSIKKEKLLTEERLKLVNQQIQPHFIFNSLSLIRYLIKKSPDEAVETVNEFSGYLRGCTDFLNEVSCIPVTRELDLVRHYVFMEQKRFGKSISVEYDTEDVDFEIPPFTIQTSVENAIKHGLRSANIEDGKITVSTCKEGKNHIVIITDNGVGFDKKAIDKTTNHVGIKNSEERLRLMCGGSFDIQSKLNEGTKVTIKIPEKG